MQGILGRQTFRDGRSEVVPSSRPFTNNPRNLLRKATTALPSEELVLIVEDDRATAELERRALLGMGMSIDIVDTVDRALACLHDRQVTLALVDYRLPDGTALRVLEEARLVIPSVPTIVITGNGDEKVVVEVLRRGASDYIIKRDDFWKDLPVVVTRVLKEVSAGRANARLASIVQSSSDAIIGTSPDGVITTWSAGAVKTFRFFAGEAQGEHISRFFAGRREWEVERLLRSVRGGDTITRHETTWVRAGGGQMHVSLTLSPVKDRTGSVIGVSIIARDISKQKRVEDSQLRRQQAAIAAIGQRALNSPDPADLMRETVSAVARILETDHCRILELLPDGQALFAHDAIGDCGILERAELLLADKVMRSQQPVIWVDSAQEARFLEPSRFREQGTGSALGVLIRGSKLLYGVMVAFTHRSAFSEQDLNFVQAVANILGTALERAAGSGTCDEHFRQIAENISEMFFVMDAKTEEMIYVSPACERIWGQSQGQILARPMAWIDSIHPEDRQRVVDAFIEKRDAGRFDETFRLLPHRDGRIRWVSSRVFPVRDVCGRIYRYTGIVSDIRDLETSHRNLTEKAVQCSSPG